MEQVQFLAEEVTVPLVHLAQFLLLVAVLEVLFLTQQEDEQAVQAAAAEVVALQGQAQVIQAVILQ